MSAEIKQLLPIRFVKALFGANTPSASNVFVTNSDISEIKNPTTNYATPLDADKIGIWDVANSLFKAVTWANLKATLKTYFDTLYSKNITVASTVTPAGHTGNTNETILGTPLTIPAGIFISNDEMEIRPTANTLGAVGSKELKLYLNTTPDLTGTPIQIGRIITTVGAQAGIKIQRYFDVESSNLIKDSVIGSANVLTDLVNNGAFTTFAPDLTVTQYLIATGTLTVAGDTINLQSLRILRNRP